MVLSKCIISVAYFSVITATVVVTREELRLFYFQQTLQFSFFIRMIFFSFFFFQLIKTISLGFFSYLWTDQYSNIL